MIYKNPTDTTFGQYHNVAPVVRGITEAIIKDNIQSKHDSVAKHTMGFTTDLVVEPIVVCGYYPSEATVPAFNHPVKVEYSGVEYVCIDIRNFVQPKLGNPVEQAFIIKDDDEFTLLKLRLATQMIWLTSNPDALKKVHDLPAKVFGDWISQSICSRFGMGALEKFIIQVTAIVFYLGLFSEVPLLVGDSLSPEEKSERMLLTKVVARLTGANYEDINMVLNKIPAMNSVSDLAKAISVAVPNIRVENFEVLGLITIITNSWFGHDAKEVLKIAIEHPPTWISLVYAALNEKRFKNSGLAKICERHAKAKGGDDFIRSLNMLIKSRVMYE